MNHCDWVAWGKHGQYIRVSTAQTTDLTVKQVRNLQIALYGLFRYYNTTNVLPHSTSGILTLPVEYGQKVWEISSWINLCACIVEKRVTTSTQNQSNSYSILNLNMVIIKRNKSHVIYLNHWLCLQWTSTWTTNFCIQEKGIIHFSFNNYFAAIQDTLSLWC